MFNRDAGHTHRPTRGYVTGCPLCDTAKTTRNQAITHLSEALHQLTKPNPTTDLPTIRLNMGPIGVTGDDVPHCHSIDLTARQADAIADAVNSMNAYLGSEQPPPVHAVPPVTREDITTGEWSAAAVAQNDPDLYADVTDLFDGIDPESYLDDVFTADSPEASMAAYEQLVTGEWDGEL